MKSKYNNWLNSRIKLSDNLYRGACGGTYIEANIVICSLISGIASMLWPGKNIDRKRFVELIVKYSAPCLNANRISLPLLYRGFLNKKQIKYSDALVRCFNKLETWSSEVYIENDIDVFESDLIKNIKHLPLKNIRQYSYANILYTDIRSGFIHEYKLSKDATSVPMTTRKANISYVNRVDPPTNGVLHLICFHYEWTKNITKSIIKNTQTVIENNHTFPFPNKWWIDG